MSFLFGGGDDEPQVIRQEEAIPQMTDPDTGEENAAVKQAKIDEANALRKKKGHIANIKNIGGAEGLEYDSMKEKVILG